MTLFPQESKKKKKSLLVVALSRLLAPTTLNLRFGIFLKLMFLNYKNIYRTQFQFLNYGKQSVCKTSFCNSYLL